MVVRQLRQGVLSTLIICAVCWCKISGEALYCLKSGSHASIISQSNQEKYILEISGGLRIGNEPVFVFLSVAIYVCLTFHFPGTCDHFHTVSGFEVA